MDKRDRDDDRDWRHLRAVPGYGPLGLCDCCVQPLETLSDLRTGRCAACVVAQCTPTSESAAHAAAYNRSVEDPD